LLEGREDVAERDPLAWDFPGAGEDKSFSPVPDA